MHTTSMLPGNPLGIATSPRRGCRYWNVQPVRRKFLNMAEFAALQRTMLFQKDRWRISAASPLAVACSTSTALSAWPTLRMALRTRLRSVRRPVVRLCPPAPPEADPTCRWARSGPKLISTASTRPDFTADVAQCWPSRHRTRVETDDSVRRMMCCHL